MKRVVVWITPMGKPRMTQRDKWAKRPCVMKYRAFSDELRRQVKGEDFEDAYSLSWVAYLPIPKSWSKKKKEEMRGDYHRQKPDRDNIDKAILDTLFKDDSGIAIGNLTKKWDDGQGPRIELTWSCFGEQCFPGC